LAVYPPSVNFSADALVYWAIFSAATKEVNKGPPLKDVRTKLRKIDLSFLVRKCTPYRNPSTSSSWGCSQWRKVGRGQKPPWQLRCGPLFRNGPPL